MNTNSDSKAAVADAFDGVLAIGLQDIARRRLRYHLLRLTVAGLAREDIGDLLVLADRAFSDVDTGPAATAITGSAEASPLARCIAEIVGQPSRAHPRDRLLGAVFGAYAGVAKGPDDQKASMAMTGALAGALALSLNTALGVERDRQLWDIYLEPLPDQPA